MLQREKHEWLLRRGKAEDWAEAARSFSTRDAFEKAISPKDLKNQLCFLVWKLDRASHPGSSKPTPCRRPFSFQENIGLLAWAVGFDVLPPELSGSRKKLNGETPIDHLNLWKKSINLAKVAETLAASPLWHDSGRIPNSEDVGEAIDVVGGVLESTGVEHLVRNFRRYRPRA